MSPSPPFPIAADVLLAFHRCQRQPYLERFGPQDKREAPSDFLNHLRRDRLALLADIQAAFPGESAQVYRPRIAPEVTAPEVTAPENGSSDRDRLAHLQQRAERTRALMDAGAELIYDGVLLDLEGVALVSFPDALVRLERQDAAFRWYYAPAIVRTGKQVKPPYRLALAIASYLLERTRGHTIARGRLVLRDRQWRHVDLTHALSSLPGLIQDFTTAFSQPEAPEVHMSRSRCGLCSWYDYCRDRTRATRPLALLPGVTAPRFQALRAAGIDSIAHLADADISVIKEMPGIGHATASKLISQAQATHDGKAIALKPFSFPQATVELYFDIEADLTRNAAYLLGVLVVDGSANSAYYQACLADYPDGEGDNWVAFLEFVARYPEAPIYHFHSFEIQTCRRLTEVYDTDRATLETVIERMVDLHPIVSQCMALPTESYSLKHIARWLGFSWRQSDADGAQSIFWYAQWLETGDRDFLNATVTYNEDDCRATYHLKQWLETHAERRSDELKLQAPTFVLREGG